jgi:hypothetical protein
MFRALRAMPDATLSSRGETQLAQQQPIRFDEARLVVGEPKLLAGALYIRLEQVQLVARTGWKEMVVHLVVESNQENVCDTPTSHISRRRDLLLDE